MLANKKRKGRLRFVLKLNCLLVNEPRSEVLCGLGLQYGCWLPEDYPGDAKGNKLGDAQVNENRRSRVLLCALKFKNVTATTC